MRSGRDMAFGKSYDVTVIGGGIAGLVASYDCMRAGKTVLLVEKTQRLGGRIRAVDVAGVAVDAGAESFAVRTDSVVGLAEGLGIGSRIIMPARDESWLYNCDEERPYATTKPAVLGIPDLDSGDPEVLVGSLGADGYARALRDLSTPWSITAEVLDTMSLGALVECRLGRAVMERFVIPMVRAVYGVDPYSMPVDGIIPGFAQAAVEQQSVSKAAVSFKRRLVEGSVSWKGGRAGSGAAASTVMSFEGGMTTLTDALASALGGSPFVDIVMGAEAEEAGLGRRPHLVTYAGVKSNSRTTVRSAAVVNAYAPELPHETGRRHITVILAALRSEELDGDPRGAGIIVYGSVPYSGAKAATHISAKWADRPDLARLRATGVHVIRLSFDDGVWEKLTQQHGVVDIITNNITALFGVNAVRSDSVIDWRRVTHQGTGEKDSGVGERMEAVVNGETSRCRIWVGHALSGGSVTGIVADTRREVKKMLEVLG